jgi:hypothetical protein
MRSSELDYILATMLDSNKDVSDLNITVDKPLQVESSGQLVGVPITPPVDRLTPFQTEQIALNLLGGSRRLTEDLFRTGSCDSSYGLGQKARFRKLLLHPAQAGHPDPHAGAAQAPTDLQGDREGEDRPRPHYRIDRLGQIHHPRGAVERLQREQIHPHRHARGSG